MQLLSGWQGDNAGGTRVPANADCLPNTGCAAPTFANHYVKTPVLTGVTGKMLARIINRSGRQRRAAERHGQSGSLLPGGFGRSNAGDTMTIVTHETIDGDVTVGGTVPNSDWKYCGGGTFDAPQPVTVLPVQVCMKGGFDPTKLYQLVYRAKDPYVLGAGTAAFRDVQSFFRYESKDDDGTANPLYGYIHWAIIRGVSQSGNFTRHFIHLGMNQDEAGRIVHEGAWPLIAGRRVANNSRWGQPDGVLELYQMGSEGPAVVGEVARRGARSADGRHSRPLQEVPHLPEGDRDVRRRRGLCAEDDDVVGGHVRRPRYPATEQRAQVLPAELDARRRQRCDHREPVGPRSSAARATTGATGRCERIRFLRPAS